MTRFGNIVQGSMRRGKIKGSSVENGTRYLQMTGIKQAVPVSNKFGRFEVRIFCDNNKILCKFCSLTDHEYFRCPSKINMTKKCYICADPSHLKRDCPHSKTPTKRCYVCQSETHVAKDCKQDVYCTYCGVTGHRRVDCSARKEITYEPPRRDNLKQIFINTAIFTTKWFIWKARCNYKYSKTKINVDLILQQISNHM